MIDVTLQNFEAEVIEASLTTPVLVDFWAAWCAPCVTLGPLLEKLETAYEGRFKLVKIDADQEQKLAGAFGVRSLPTCVLLMNGQPVDGFMGALPEGQIREFLDKHLPPAELEAEEEVDELPVAEPGSADALDALRQAAESKPEDDDARFDYVCALWMAGLDDEAKVAFAPVIARAAGVRRLDSLQRVFAASDFAAGQPPLPQAIAACDTRITANRRDFEARFDRARLLMATHQYTQALDELLEILMRDKTWNEDLARKTYIAILDLIEPPKPKVAEGQIPPDDPVVASYRRRLSSVVLS
jgi:putative thioredoxin